MDKKKIEKRKAARKALELIKDGMVVGLGSGSTVKEFIAMLGKKVRDGLDIWGVPTSYDTEILAVAHGIKMINPLEVDKVDISIDGADVVSKKGIIKGGGAALTREKIIAYNAKKFVVIVDKSKIKERLGGKVPIEVLPFGYRFAIDELQEFKPKLRMAERKLGPIMTDNGNVIIDLEIDEIKRPKEMEKYLNSFPGVFENGIFTKSCDVIVGKEEDAEVIKLRL